MLLITMEDAFPKMATMLSSFRAYFVSPMPAIVAPYPLRPTKRLGLPAHGAYIRS